MKDMSSSFAMKSENTKFPISIRENTTIISISPPSAI